jgi:hypothetical protein
MLCARQLAFPAPLWGSTHKAHPPDFSSWIGESLEYRVDCQLLKNLAVSRLSFQRIKGSHKFLAKMEVQLQGVVGALSMQRRELFASLMAWSENHKRFLPLWYADQASWMGKWRRKVLVFRHNQERYVEYKFYPDRSRKRRRKTKGRLLNDPLSAFYNWRVGAFGQLRTGAVYRIDNLARKERFSLGLKTASEAETRSRRAQPNKPKTGVYMASVEPNDEFRDSVKGGIHMWFNDLWIPVYCEAKGVKWLGSVTCRLVQRDFISDRERPSKPRAPLTKEFWRI